MGQVLSHSLWPRVLLVGFAVWLASLLLRGYREKRKIKRLGGHAAVRKTWAPLALDMIYEAILYASRDENLKFWHKNFMLFGKPENPYTLEATAFGHRMIFTADPENIKAILATQFNDYGKGKQFHDDWHDFLGDSIFTTDGKRWSDSRQLIRPQFIKDRVSDLEVFERGVETLLPVLGGNGQVIDVKDLFFRFTLDAATDFLFGRSVDSLTNGQSEFAEAFQEVQRIQSYIARAGPLQFLVPRREFRRHLRTLNAFVDPFIDAALALPPDELEKRGKSDEGYTFLHAIACYTRDRAVLRDQLVAVLLAGRDTTAATLSWLFHEISQNAEIVRKLREEIERVVGWNRAPQYAELKSMKYLQACLSETLRLYPAIPFNMRIALHDTTLPHGGGPDGNSPIGILKDTSIGYSPHYMHLKPEFYPPPSEKLAPPYAFSPERWEHWQPKPWTYIPFNGGPRICVGQQFALTEMGYVIVRVLQRFARVEARSVMREAPFGLKPGEKVEQKSGATLVNGWARGRAGQELNEPSLVEKAVESNIAEMKSDIVLQPADKVKLAFYYS